MEHMSTVATLEFASNSLEDTLRFATKIGHRLKGGETIELRSDVGGGKTTFVRGLAGGAGSTDQVASPTFTISKVYTGHSDIRINHFDFYRLSDPGVMQGELGESVTDPNSVTIVEWAGLVEDVLPIDRLIIEVSTTGENSRQFKLSAGPDHAHLVQLA